MRKNVFVYAILIICTVLLISCNTNDNAIQLSDNDQIIIREYLDNDTGRSLTSNDSKSYSAFKVLGTSTNEIYLFVLKQNESGAGTATPLVLTTEKKNGTLNITSFKMPGDGDSYSKDIKEMFPKSVQNQIFCDIDEYNQMIEDLQNQINELKAAN